VGAALLDTLSDGDLVQLLQSERATEALREAVKSRAMYLVGRPRVQVYLRQIWRGRLFHQLISGKVYTPLRDVVQMTPAEQTRLWPSSSSSSYPATCCCCPSSSSSPASKGR